MTWGVTLLLFLHGMQARTRLLLLTGVTNVHVQFPSAARNVAAEMAYRGLPMRRLMRGGVMAKEQHLERALGVGTRSAAQGSFPSHWRHSTP